MVAFTTRVSITSHLAVCRGQAGPSYQGVCKKSFVEFELTATAGIKAEVTAVAKSKYRGINWTIESPYAIFGILPK